jgi:hypothetical protein
VKEKSKKKQAVCLFCVLKEKVKRRRGWLGKFASRRLVLRKAPLLERFVNIYLRQLVDQQALITLKKCLIKLNLLLAK